MTDEQINELKRNKSIAEVFAENGVRINSRGFAKCPLHKGDRSASMKVYLDQGSFYCYGCHSHGDIIDFTMKMNNCDFKTAYTLLGGRTEEKLTKEQKEKIAHQRKLKEEYRLFLNDVNRRIAETEYIIAECERGIRFEGILQGEITNNMVEYGKALIKAERDLEHYNKIKFERMRNYERHIEINTSRTH